eukprot:gene3015-5909_t
MSLLITSAVKYSRPRPLENMPNKREFILSLNLAMTVIFSATIMIPWSSIFAVSQASSRHENKPNPAPIPYDKIVEAYGLRKCPKLVEQVADDSIEVRINALCVLCDEFNNPYSIQGCAQAGVIKILASMVSDPDYTTRDKASLALAIAARDSNGLMAILEDEAIPEILQGINDPAPLVRAQVYECLYQATRTLDGVSACVKAGVAKELVKALMDEDDRLKPIMLRTIHNACKVELGLKDALTFDVVRICIQLLEPSQLNDVVVDAARTLGFICFADDAKDTAIAEGAVPALVELLKSRLTTIRSAATLALMAVTSTDEGKRQVLPCGGVPLLIELLRDQDKIVRCNTLKVISNVAVFPGIRSILVQEIDCMAMLKEMADSSDVFLSKHAKVSLAAVMWTA